MNGVRWVGIAEWEQEREEVVHQTLLVFIILA